MRRSSLPVLTAVAMAALMAASAATWAADPGPTPDKFTFWLEPTSAEAAQGQTVEVLTLLKIDQGIVQGWSFGVCTADQAVATVTEATVTGTDSATVNGGAKPGFEQSTTYPGGATSGVVIDLMQTNSLPPTARFSMLKLTYRMDGAPGAQTGIDYCATLGTPPVDAVVVVGGLSIVPATQDGATLKVKANGGQILPTLTTLPASQELAADMVATVDVQVGIGLAADSNAANAEGWSYAIAHDGALLELTDIKKSALTDASNGGNAPDFWQANKNPAGGAGGTVGCVISLSPPFNVIPLAAGEKKHTETFTYRSKITLNEGDPDRTTELSMAHEALGDPPVAAVMSVDGDGLRFTEAGRASIVLTGGGGPPPRLRKFIRGNANNDAYVNIADGVWVLNWIYRGGREPPCRDAADANDDGKVDQADAILIVYYQLRQGTQPSAPFPSCGTDPNELDSDSPTDGVSCKAIGSGCPAK